MTRTTSNDLDKMFEDSFLQYISKEKQLQTEYVTSHVLEQTQYAMAVGCLRTLEAVEQKYKDLVKAFYAN